MKGKFIEKLRIAEKEDNLKLKSIEFDWHVGLEIIKFNWFVF